MEPFLRSDQYNFIKAQTQILISGYATSNDHDVRLALRANAKDKVCQVAINEEQEELLASVAHVKNREEAEVFLEQVRPFVIPFKEITEQTLKKLFPKEKKLKAPLFEEIDLREISYLSWIDKGSNKKYIVTHDQNGKLVGLQGTFTSVNKKGICSFCNGYEEIGMFVSKTKGSLKSTTIKRGNYICEDSIKCNQNLITLDKLHDFMDRLNN